MSLDLEELNRPTRTRWLALKDRLEGVDILAKLGTPLETTRWRNRMASRGILNPTRDNPLNVSIGRESEYFFEVAKEYVHDWRGDIKPKDAPFNVEQMGKVLGAYQVAYVMLMSAVMEERTFFDDGRKNSMPS